ncbi:unnamed protein product [Urochloa humidicola]
MAPSSLLFLSLVWVARSASPVLATAARAAAGVEEHCPSVLCGNLTISSPFALFPVQASQKHCMRFGFAFQVSCLNNNIPYPSYYDGEDSFHILDIFYYNSSLLVIDVDELQDFSSCHIPTNNISKPPDPFLISAANQNLIFYNCTKAPATIDSELVPTRCGNNTFVRVGGPYGSESGSYFLEGCDAVAMPVLEGSVTDASRYQELISGGFLLTWQRSGCCTPNMVQKRGTTDCQCAYPVRVKLLLHNVSLTSNWSNAFLGEFASQLNVDSTQFEIVNFYVFGDTGLNITMDIVPQTGVSFSADEVTTMNNSLSLHTIRVSPDLVGDYSLLNLTWFRPLAPAPGSNRTDMATVPIGSNKTGRKTTLIVSVAIAATLLRPCIFVLIWHRKEEKLNFLQWKKTSSSERNIEALILSHGSLGPKRYQYSETTKITSSCNSKLGEGGYGVVFKGRLTDGRLVAVKFLHDSKGEGEEFVNEVMSISRTSHVNIVSLFGFCLEGSKRALIYEFMPNGSLDKYIYSEDPKAVLGWDKLYTIAIGVARGLEYLHHSCNTRIIHFDIKPQNILLDQDFCPKIADFGLAKLSRTKESKLSMTGTRGTVGFIAPEVHSRSFGVVSTKSDVYSYGMLLLEMVGGRTNVNSMVQNSSEKYFPHWIYDHLCQDDGLQACDITHEVEGITKKMSLIGLWCIQILPMHRPTITKALEMFERGLDELDMPPKQSFSQKLLNAEGTSTSSGAKTQDLSGLQKIKEITL